MSHYTRTHWWTLVLILAFAFSSAAVVMPSSALHADVIDEGGGGGGGGGGISGFGDPDVPTGISVQTLPESRGRGVVVGSARVAGDGGELSNIGTWRLQTWVALLRGYFFRF